MTVQEAKELTEKNIQYTNEVRLQKDIDEFYYLISSLVDKADENANYCGIMCSKKMIKKHVLDKLLSDGYIIDPMKEKREELKYKSIAAQKFFDTIYFIRWMDGNNFYQYGDIRK